MNIVPDMGTLIYDDRDNYYHAIRINEDRREIVLRNAFIDYSFSRIVSEDYLKEHLHQFTGKYAMDCLYNKIAFLKKSETLQDGDPNKSPLKMVSLEDVKNDYLVRFENYYEPKSKFS